MSLKNKFNRYLLILLCLLFVKTAFATPVQIAVLYPETRGSFSKIFENIISGIKDNKDIEIVSRVVSKNTTAEEIDAWLINNNAQSIVSLGRLCLKLSKALTSTIPVTVGALVIAPNGHSGISLAGDPGAFLRHLQDLAPNVKRVFVVYSESNSGWLVEMAKVIANDRNIELITLKASDIKEGVKHYEDILQQVKSGEDAIWIPLDRIVPVRTLLPKVLQAAWERNIVIFSNNPLHTKKGTLFSLFPDHVQMGRNLAQIAIEQTHQNSGPRVVPAKSLKLAVNRRTASHLGLNFSKRKERQFDIVFPSR